MNVALTIVVLATMMAAMLILRVAWIRLPPRLRFGLVTASVTLVAIQAFCAATKWGTTSDRLNTIIYWLAVAGYGLLILLFSRLSPRWLTSLSAAVLLLLVFTASILLSLSEIFESSHVKKIPVGNHLFYEAKPWRNTGAGMQGVDVIVSYRPPFAPFLRHKMQIIPFNDHECNSRAAIAIPSPRTKTVLGSCPRWPSESGGPVNKLLPLS
jgi:hypothetical protein